MARQVRCHPVVDKVNKGQIDYVEQMALINQKTAYSILAKERKMNHSKSKTILGVVAIVVAFPCGVFGATLNVPGDFATIQGCIDAAVSGVDECVVASGTYNECINFSGQAITVRSADGPDVTTIDGFGLNCSVVQCVNGEGLDTVLDGFTITGGNPPTAAGGGMNNVGSSPTVHNCVFTLNTGNDNGGGMHNLNSNPRVENCSFVDNVQPADGAGMYNSNSNPTVSNCLFSGNSVNAGVNRHGGGMANTGGSHSIVTNCLFINNVARGGTTNNAGGGMSNSTNSQPTITNCTFIGNSADDNGGGIWAEAGSQPTIVNSIFWANVDDAEGGSGGPFTDESAQVHDAGASASNITYSCIQSCTAFCSNPPDQNIGADPLFVTGPLVPPFGDWYLSQITSGQGADSLCVDAGSGPVSDFYLAGTTRTDQVDDIGVVDMGYHYNATLAPPPPIPAVSEWGLIVLLLLVVTVGTLVFARGRSVPA